MSFDKSSNSGEVFDKNSINSTIGYVCIQNLVVFSHWKLVGETAKSSPARRMLYSIRIVEE